MTVPNILANGPGNWPDAAKFMDNLDYLDAIGRGTFISNPGFELWTGGTSFVNPADNTAIADRWLWRKSGTTAPIATISRETTNKDTGAYAIKIDVTTAGSSDSIADVQQQNANFILFAGLTVILGARVKASTANKVRLKITDGVTTAYSAYHSGGGGWESLYVTLAVAAAPTLLYSSIELEPADFTGQVYADSSFLFIVRPSISSTSKAALAMVPPDPGDLSNDIAAINASIVTVNAQLTKMGIHNRLINGAFSVNQRGATSVADDVYHLDRWYALNETGNVTIAQQTDQENGQPTNLRMTQPDVSAKRIGVAQIIESINCRDLRGSNVVLSARIRSSASQAIRYAILEHTGTADSVTSDVVGTWSNGTYTPSNFFIAGLTVVAVGSITPSAATWTAISLTGAVSASCNNLIVVFWTEGTFAQNATLDVGKAQLEAGSTATAFEYLPFDVAVAQCQRYYEKSYDLATAPGATTSVGGYFGVGRVTSATNIDYFPPVFFKARKRAAPNLSFWQTGGTAGSWSGMSAAETPKNQQTSQHSFAVYLNAQSGLTAGLAGYVSGQWVAEIEL
jgi:hypothetical protein